MKTVIIAMAEKLPENMTAPGNRKPVPFQIP